MGNVETDTVGKSVLFIPFLAFSASKKCAKVRQAFDSCNYSWNYLSEHELVVRR